MNNKLAEKALSQRSIWRKILDPTIDGIYEVDGEVVCLFGINFIGLFTNCCIYAVIFLLISMWFL